MTLHIETPSAVLATRLVEDINQLRGYPRAATRIGSGTRISIAAIEAWVAGGAQGTPPPGAIKMWATPLQHPTNPARHSVPVVAGLVPSLIGRQPPGWARALAAQDVTTRGPEWVSAAPEGELREPSRL